MQSDGRRWSRASGVLAVLATFLVLVGLAAALSLAARGVGLLSADAAWWLVPAVVVVGLPVSALAGRGARRRHARGSVVECAIRPPGSPTGRWRHGRVQPAAGGLVFVPGGPGGMRFPRGRPRPFTIAEMSDDDGRRPSPRQVWSINPALHVVTVTVDGQRLELAALPEDLDRLRRLATPT